MARRRERGPWFWRTAIGGMLACVFGLFAIIAFNQPPTLLADTGCRADRKDPAHTILVIDQSDPFNPNDLDWVYEFVDAEARALPRFGKLSVLTPNAASPYEPKVIYVGCTPGSASDANPITQNPKMIEAAWENEFYKPLIAEVELAMTDTRQPSSPLAESVYAISDRADFQHGRDKRRIVLVSDLMQHSADFSFYKVGADYDAFLDTPLAETFPNMDNVEVVARIVPRQMYDLPMGEVKAFWRAYFAQAGAEYGSVN